MAGSRGDSWLREDRDQEPGWGGEVEISTRNKSLGDTTLGCVCECVLENNVKKETACFQRICYLVGGEELVSRDNSM